jgi:hypothetical protein
MDIFKDIGTEGLSLFAKGRDEEAEGQGQGNLRF